MSLTVPTAATKPPADPAQPPASISTTRTVAMLDVEFGTPGASIRYVEPHPGIYAVAYDRDCWSEDSVRTIMRMTLRTEDEDIEFIGPDEIRNQAGLTETMSALPGCGDCEQVEGPKIRVDLDGSTFATAGISLWPAEEGKDGAPSFAASNEIVLDVQSGPNPVAMNAAEARSVAAGLHQFADQLTTLAAELDAIGAA